MSRTATYKGKTYRLEFLGDTKFGRRAKLAFMDGSKEFWVAADLVTPAGPVATPGNPNGYGYEGNQHRRCVRCGEKMDNRGRLCWDCKSGAPCD